MSWPFPPNSRRLCSGIFVPGLFLILLASPVFGQLNPPSSPPPSGVEGDALPEEAADGSTVTPAEEVPEPPPVGMGAFDISAKEVPAVASEVGAADLPKWGHLLPPSIQWAVAQGARLRIGDRIPIALEPARQEATERYHAQVRLSDEKTHAENYVAGIPFPFLADDDPDAGIKIILNSEARVVQDDLTVRYFGCQTGDIGDNQGMRVQRSYIVQNFRRLYFVGRLYHEPTPIWETQDGIRYRELLHPVVEPFDLKGAGFTYNRYMDPARQDDSWLYFPLQRRVRRLSTAQRSEGVFGQDVDLDSYGGWAGNPAWMKWRLVGTKTMLTVMNGQQFPGKWLPPPTDWIPDEIWEPREVYILEATPKFANYAFGKRLVYVDRQSYFIPYSEMFDREGNLWKALLQTWVFAPRGNAIVEPAPYEKAIIPSLVLFDMATNHATRCRLPPPDGPGDRGWYTNVGDVSGTVNDVFDVSNFIGTGR